MLSTKARSRLKKSNSAKTESVQPKASLISTLKMYFKALPTLAIGLVFALLTGFIVTSFYPSQVANIGVTNGYLVLIIPFALANFFLLSFVMLNARRGLLLSIFLSSLLWLRVGGVALSWWFVLGFGGYLCMIELVCSSIDGILAKQNTQTRSSSKKTDPEHEAPEA